MRLIDADALLEQNKELADCEIEHPKYQMTLREVVDEMPTIAERKKGRWNIKLIRPVYGGVTFRVDARCSECGVFIAQTTTQRKMTYRFCPYCGADMRGEDDGKENTD